MATIREWLNGSGFVWDKGIIIYQAVREDADAEYPQYASAPGYADENDVTPGVFVAATDPILDMEFDNSYGAPSCPRFFARDNAALYFPSQYDGSTRIVRVEIDPMFYMQPGNLTPYPGA